MTLLDSLSRKASGVREKAIQKTKEISDITRLNSQISEEEKQLSNYYYQLGKQFYSVHTADCEDDFKPLFNSILEAEKKIEEMKKQVQDLKGVQICVKCGAEVDRSASFCSSCGEPVPKTAVPEEVYNTVVCDKCGAKNKKGNRFCTYCGYPLTRPEAVPVEPLREEVKCPNCGAGLEAGSVFCTECGSQIIVESWQ